MIWIILLIIGVAAGTIGGLIGLGGGIITVPALIYLSGMIPELSHVTPQVAVGTSLLVIIFTGLSSTLSYMKRKLVDYKSGFIFFIGSAPGGIVGAWLNSYFNVNTFLMYFGIFMIVIAGILMIRGRIKPLAFKKGLHTISRKYIDENQEERFYGYHPTIAIIISFIVGLLGGLFGVGGGALMVPAMLLLFAFPPNIAIATSMMLIFLSSIVSSVAHISMNNVNWLLTAILIPGAWFGGKLGAYINSKLKNNTIIIIFRFALMVMGARLIYQGLF